MSADAATAPALTLRVPPEVAAIPMARLVLRRVLPPLGPDDSSLYFGAVTEILTNAIEAHQRHRNAEWIVVSVDLVEPAVIVIDCGAGFDPDERSVDDAPVASSTDGLGLVIARTVCPEIRFESSIEGTAVSLPYPMKGQHDSE